MIGNHKAQQELEQHFHAFLQFAKELVDLTNQTLEQVRPATLSDYKRRRITVGWRMKRCGPITFRLWRGLCLSL